MTETLKRASWLELFYDLAFVALIAQLTYLVADHHTTITDWLNIALVGYLIYIAWWGTTANRNLQDSESTADRLFIQLQMAGAFMMSLTMPDVFAGDMTRFFATFAAVRGIQIIMLLRMYRLYPDDAPQTKNVLQSMIVSTVLWSVIGLVAMPYFYVVAFCALAIDTLGFLSTGKGNTIRLLNVNHMQERLGLFLMLVIGESMLVVALANTATSVDLARPVIVLSGLGLMVALWWLYFAYLERCAEGVRPKNLFIFVQAHAWLFGGVVLMASSYKNMLKHNEPTSADLLLLGAGYFVMMGALVLIRKMLHGLSLKKSITTIFFCLGIIILVGLGYYYEQSLAAVLALTGVTIALAAFDHYKSVRRI